MDFKRNPNYKDLLSKSDFKIEDLAKGLPAEMSNLITNRKKNYNFIQLFKSESPVSLHLINFIVEFAKSEEVFLKNKNLYSIEYRIDVTILEEKLEPYLASKIPDFSTENEAF